MPAGLYPQSYGFSVSVRSWWASAERIVADAEITRFGATSGWR